MISMVYDFNLNLQYDHKQNIWRVCEMDKNNKTRRLDQQTKALLKQQQKKFVFVLFIHPQTTTDDEFLSFTFGPFMNKAEMINGQVQTLEMEHVNDFNSFIVGGLVSKKRP
ncbi:CLUMA_CG012390, isoform A [Clunio marinus]|uniref:CLUMA_CG012390, isoform A n=1 Tax=Clunio marinus TaxID=568069 RepID=A0A1J1IG12_9DIPT|nr:CLUMA_CG012390, isoform A [Clunio marinus]